MPENSVLPFLSPGLRRAREQAIQLDQERHRRLGLAALRFYDRTGIRIAPQLLAGTGLDAPETGGSRRRNLGY